MVRGAFHGIFPCSEALRLLLPLLPACSVYTECLLQKDSECLEYLFSGHVWLVVLGRSFMSPKASLFLFRSLFGT